MKTSEIIREIRNLPIAKRIYVIEKSIRSIRDQEEKDQLKKAADKLYTDYSQDKELTLFTDSNYDDFYQAK